MDWLEKRSSHIIEFYYDCTLAVAFDQRTFLFDCDVLILIRGVILAAVIHVTLGQ